LEDKQADADKCLLVLKSTTESHTKDIKQNFEKMQDWDEKSNQRFILFLVWAKAYALESSIQKNALNISINLKKMEQNDSDRKFYLIFICS